MATALELQIFSFDLGDLSKGECGIVVDARWKLLIF